MKLISNEGLGINADEGSYPLDQISSVKITYTDGSEYIVFNENTANYGNLVGDDAGYTSVFNRLVDTSNVAKITVNSTEYTAE